MQGIKPSSLRPSQETPHFFAASQMGSWEKPFRKDRIALAETQTPPRSRRVMRADRGRSLRTRVSAAERSRARSLSRYSSTDAVSGSVEPEVGLTQKQPYCPAAPPEQRSSTATAARLPAPQPPRRR